jgi:hypothetical protein
MVALWVSLLSGIFLAFGWPFVASRDPAGEPFRVLATATLVVFLAALVGLAVMKALARRGESGSAE